MNIGIDGNEANLTTQRVGVGQFAFKILHELSRQKSDHQYYIYLSHPPLSDLPKPSSNWQYFVFGPTRLWTKIALPLHLYLKSPHLDLFYSPNHYSPHICPCPTIPTIHDLGYLDTPHQFTKKDYYQLSNWTKRSIKKAHRIVAVSQFTKNEIIRIYGIDPSIIDLVYNGISPLFDIPKSTQKAILKKFNLTKPYFLDLGTLKPNKNIPFLIRSFSVFLANLPAGRQGQRSREPAFQLVIAGKKGWLFNDIFQVVKEYKLENNIIFTDYITETEKQVLYLNSYATVLPSLYEGFGIPAIEAQQSLSPVIASSIPPYTEILQDSALIIDPTNEKEMTQAFVKISHPSTRQDLIKRGLINSQQFSWSNSAKSLQKVFDTI